tara:strand:+ start:215 stop:742 length:528 start_codon:yes stop_codon:yes gene_type:complete
MQTANNEKYNAHMQRARSLRLDGNPGCALKHEVHANTHYMGFGVETRSGARFEPYIQKPSSYDIKLQRLGDKKDRRQRWKEEFITLNVLACLQGPAGPIPEYMVRVVDGVDQRYGIRRGSELILSISKYGKAELRHKYDDWQSFEKISLWEFEFEVTVEFLNSLTTDTIEAKDLP